ncbi:MAG: acyltransferase family protein [Cyanobacteria bacterium J06656_5]
MTWINNARIVSTFAVVFLHVAIVFMLDNDIDTEYWWFGNIFNVLVRWCVPSFVMISGALLLDNKNEESLSKFYSKRLSRVLIPILFWSIMYLGLTFIHGLLDQNPPSLTNLLGLLSSGLPYEHMWFLYMILGLYLFTPFFRKIVTFSDKKEISFLVISTFTIASINFIYNSHYARGTSDLFINWFLLYIPFFFTGYLIQKDHRKPPRVVLWSIFLLSCIISSVGHYLIAINNQLFFDSYFYGFTSLTVIAMSVSVMYLLKSCSSPILGAHFNKQLTLLTLGIYLIHPVIIEIVNKIGYLTKFHPIIAVPSMTIVVFVISLLIAWVLHQLPYLRRTI